MNFFAGSQAAKAVAAREKSGQFRAPSNVSRIPFLNPNKSGHWTHHIVNTRLHLHVKFV